MAQPRAAPQLATLRGALAPDRPVAGNQDALWRGRRASTVAERGVILRPVGEPAEPASGASGQEPAEVAAGRELFDGTCAHCHGPGAVTIERRINLRLMQHRYGDKMDETFMHTVTHGRPQKGMPDWTGALDNDQFAKILAFLHSVQTK